MKRAPTWSLGRGGEGPGEFLRAAWAAEASPGRLVVLDNSLRRLSLFQSTGTLERVISLPLPPEVPGTVPSPVGLVGNEFIWSAFNLGPSACEVGGLIPDTLVWLATHLSVGDDGAEPRNPTRVLTRVASQRYWGSDLNLMGRCGPTVRTFAPRVRGLLHPPRLVIRGAREGALVLLDLNTGASDTLALPLPRAPLTAAAARAYTDSVAGAPQYDERGIPLTDPRGQNLYRHRLAAEPLPDSLPQLSELLIDQIGLFWARGFEPDARPASEWWVLSPAGELLATVSLPPGFRMLEVGADYVLGVQVDPLGVQRLEAFQLFRPLDPRPNRPADGS